MQTHLEQIDAKMAAIHVSPPVAGFVVLGLDIHGVVAWLTAIVLVLQALWMLWKFYKDVRK